MNGNIMKYTMHAYSYLKSVSRYQFITLPFVCPDTQIANLGLIEYIFLNLLIGPYLYKCIYSIFRLK